ncbi:MAG: acyl-CoA dehydrogenase family protein [Actinobacteria bacterium]|nr:acyl-CoA dehydrogenase family protein [Actinomycetota bacterium]
MDLTFTPEQQRLRAEAATWLAANMPDPPLASMDTADGFKAHRAWERQLHDAGWAVVAWPEEYGGRGLDLIEWLVFEEEYWRSGAPGRVGQNGLFLLGPTLMEHGTEEQRARFLPPMARADEIWCQGWSEPQAGSDLASLRSTARRDGEEWVLSGQKIWVSRGAFAEWMFGLFRSEPGSERHRGLSFILVPLDADGVDVRPIAQLDGETGFAEVFLDDVRVPADLCTVGHPGDGWRIAMSTAGFERGVSLRSPGRFLAPAERLVARWVESAGPGRPSARDEVLDAWMDAEAYRLYQYRTVSHVLEGGAVGFEASLNKLFWSQMDLHLHETALRLLGADAALAGDEAPDGGAWLDGFLFALAGPIYAGTNQIQRNIVAERVLDLPRSR